MAKSARHRRDRSSEAPAGAPVCLLAKVGEASLKGRNKRHFLDALRRNTRAALRGLDARVEGGGSVFVIPVPDELTAAEAASRLERVFGFVTGSVCLRCEREPERIAEVGMVAFARAQPRTFAVRVRRRDKSFPLTSQQMERQVGAAIQERTGAAGRPLAARTSSCASSWTRTAPTCTCASCRARAGCRSVPAGARWRCCRAGSTRRSRRCLR